MQVGCSSYIVDAKKARKFKVFEFASLFLCPEIQPATAYRGCPKPAGRDKIS